MQINEFQKMVRTLYYERDSKRGIKRTVEWLNDEVKELKEAIEKDDLMSTGKEFADVLAWLASLANILNIDLEKVTLSKYNNICPKCKLAPCDCKFLS